MQPQNCCFLKLQKFIAVENFLVSEFVARVRFCNWFCEAVCSGDTETCALLYRRGYLKGIENTFITVLTVRQWAG